MNHLRRRTLLALLPAAGMGRALADTDWPARTITLVLGFAPGGPNDLVARVLAQRLAQQFGQQVVVDNRPGANGNIAAGIVSRAAPDGYTLLYNSSSLALSPALYAKPPLEPLRDLAPVNGTATLPLVCVVQPSFPASNFREWVAHIRANPGRFQYGSAGNGNLAHVAAAMVLKANGLDALHVPYKGASEALQGLMGGSTNFQFDSVNSSLGPIRSGRLKALFVASPERSPALPEVPTLVESGGPEIDASAWQGVMAPPRTPPAIIQRMAAGIAKAMLDPDMKAALAAQGAYSIASTTERYAAFFAGQMSRYKKIVDDLGLKLD